MINQYKLTQVKKMYFLNSFKLNEYVDFPLTSIDQSDISARLGQDYTCDRLQSPE